MLHIFFFFFNFFLFIFVYEIIKTFNITEPMIPPRPRLNHVNGAGPSNRRNQNDDDDEEEGEDDN